MKINNLIVDKSQVDKLILDIVNFLKSYNKIQTIILFGSYARGDFSLRHSNIDLYLIIDDKKNSKFERELYMEINKLSIIPIHLNFEYLMEISEKASLLRYNILKEGTVLYEQRKNIFLKKDFDLNNVFLIKLNLSNLQANQKSNFKKSMLNKYKNEFLEYSGNLVIIKSKFLKEFFQILENKEISYTILREFLYRENQDFD